MCHVDETQDVVGRGAVMGHDKVAVPITKLRAANPFASQTGLLDECPRAAPTRVLEDAPSRLERQRLRGLLHDPQLAHSASDLLDVVTVQMESCPQDDKFVDTAESVGEREFIFRSSERLASGRHDRHAVHRLADVAAATAGIPAQGSANRARDARQRLDTRKPAPHRLVDQTRQQGPGSRMNRRPIDFDFGKRLAGDSYDHTAHAGVANQKIRATTKNVHGNAVLVAAADDAR